MKYCSECGALIEEGKKFCTSCGVKIEEREAPEQAAASVPSWQSPPAQAPAPVQERVATPVQERERAVPPPAWQEQSSPVLQVEGTKYEPITTGGFIGITLLMMLPVVNIILLLVWACGGCRKVTKTYYARASLILMLIGMMIAVILGIAGRALIKNVIPSRLTGGTKQAEQLIEAVENEDVDTLLDMGYTQKEIDEVLGY